MIPFLVSGLFYSILTRCPVFGVHYTTVPPYSPELNPAEQIWNQLRRNYFANCVFDSLNAATEQAENGLSEMAANKLGLRSLTNWPWISAILKA